MTRKIQIQYIQNKHQKEFHNDVNTKYLHLSSGFGGGKSFALVMKVIQLSRLNKDVPGGIVVQSIADYKKDLLPLFEDILDGQGIKYYYHKTDKWFRFPWSKGKIYVASAEKKIRGPNWGWCVLNEVTLIPYMRYKEAIGRVRIKNSTHPQVVSSGTPEGTGHWLFEQFIEKPMPNSRVIYGDTRDNAQNLNADYIQSLLDSYDSVMVDAYLRGLFVNMNGNRFYYSYDPIKTLDDTIRQIEGEEIHVTLDYNVSPMCATLWHVIPRLSASGNPTFDVHGNQIFECLGFDEIQILDGADTNKMCDALFARGCYPENTTIYPDPAGNSRSTKGPPDNVILKNRGFTKIRVKLVAPQFRKRQLNTNNLLDKGYVRINPIKCSGMKKDFEAVEQDTITFGKMKQNPKLTHFSDGFDYMADILYPLSGVKPDSRSVKFR